MKIHPDVEWVRFDQERLLLRMPNGEQVTFDRNVAEIETVLKHLGESGEHDRALPLFDEVFEFLNGRGLLLGEGETGERRNDPDWALRYFAFLNASTPYQMGYRAARCALRGSGWLRDCAERALRDADVELVENDPREDTLVVVLSDWDDHALFRRENEQAVRNRQRITFVGRSEVRISSGPLVVPGHSACFECYARRLSFNTQFPAEFEAHGALRAARQQSGERAPSPLARGVVEFIITRHVLAAMRELTTLVEPGAIDSFDCATLKATSRHVLKVPRCSVCSRIANKPDRCIRDLA